MKIKNHLQLNSNITVAQVYKDNFSGEAVEVEKIAEEIGIYGRVLNYIIQDAGNMFNVTFHIR